MPPSSTPTGSAFDDLVAQARTGQTTAADAAVALVDMLTDEELCWLLDGDVAVLPGLRRMASGYGTEPFIAGRVDRLGIPGVRLTDGPRGVAAGEGTSFPVPIARAATWDTALEQCIGEAIGLEARAAGANLVAAPCVNLAPAPGWGRSQESYGEDSTLIGAMGAAMVAGLRRSVMACVKHYALNSMEEARFRVDVRVSDADLHEGYLPHFRTALAGADAVMSAYNRVNGSWAGENAFLLTTVLRDMWGFPGLVLTDFIWGLRDPIGSLLAGQDIEMPFRQQRAATLPAALAGADAAAAAVRSAARSSARRILTAQVGLAARLDPAPPTDEQAGVGNVHLDLARAAAARSMVLLRNAEVDGIRMLPLHLSDGGRIAVVGRLADAANLGDIASSRVRPPSTVSALAGLRQRWGDRVVTVGDSDRTSRTAGAAARRLPRQADPGAAAELAADCEAAVVVVGLTPADEGEHLAALDREGIAALGGFARTRVGGWLIGILLRWAAARAVAGGDRRDLHLSAEDVSLINAVATVQPRTVVVVIGGGTIMLDPWDTEVAAVLLAWYPGMAGGHALADVLAGEREPTGRLPFAIPRRRSDLPTLDWTAHTVTYPSCWGQQLLDQQGTPAAYPFGFGCGYGEVTVTELTVARTGALTLSARMTVQCTGPLATRPVIGLYLSTPTLPQWRLCGFASIDRLAPGTGRTVEVSGRLDPLARWRGGGWVPPGSEITIHAARWSGDPKAPHAACPPLAPPLEPAGGPAP